MLRTKRQRSLAPASRGETSVPFAGEVTGASSSDQLPRHSGASAAEYAPLATTSASGRRDGDSPLTVTSSLTPSSRARPEPPAPGPVNGRARRSSASSSAEPGPVPSSPWQLGRVGPSPESRAEPPASPCPSLDSPPAPPTAPSAGSA